MDISNINEIINLLVVLAIAAAVADFSATSDVNAVQSFALAITGIARKTAIDNGKRTLYTKRAT